MPYLNQTWAWTGWPEAFKLTALKTHNISCSSNSISASVSTVPVTTDCEKIKTPWQIRHPDRQIKTGRPSCHCVRAEAKHSHTQTQVIRKPSESSESRSFYLHPSVCCLKAGADWMSQRNVRAVEVWKCFSRLSIISQPCLTSHTDDFAILIRVSLKRESTKVEENKRESERCLKRVSKNKRRREKEKRVE